MTLRELNANQIHQLKERILTDEHEENGEGVSYGELAAADGLVPDERVEELYGGTEFTDEDFFG